MRGLGMACVEYCRGDIALASHRRSSIHLHSTLEMVEWQEKTLSLHAPPRSPAGGVPPARVLQGQAPYSRMQPRAIVALQGLD